MSRRTTKLPNRASESAGNAPIIVEPADGIGGTPDNGSSGDAAATGDAGRTVDPAAVAGPGCDGYQPERRGRGRPRGSRNATEKSVPANISGIEKTLLTLHMMLGAVVAPELALSDDAAREYAAAIQNVNRHYNYKVFDQKTQDWLNLGMLISAVYGSRFVAIRNRKRAEFAASRVVVPRAQAGDPVPGNPAPIPQNPDGRRDIPKDLENALRTGEIPGVGKVEFPRNHPLFSETTIRTH